MRGDCGVGECGEGDVRSEDGVRRKGEGPGVGVEA